MFVEISDRGGGGGERVDIFRLALENGAGDVACDMFCDGEDRAVTYRGVGSEEGWEC